MRTAEENRQRVRAWYAANKERAKQRIREWNERNPEKRKALQKKASDKQQAKRIEQRKQNTIDNPSLVMTAEEKRQRAREKKQQWNKRNANKLAEYQRRWYHGSVDNKLKAHMFARKRRAMKLDASVGEEYEIYLWEKMIRTNSKHACYWCGDKVRGIDAHLDHVVPLSRGGKHSLDNLVIACAHCNQTKSAMMPEVFNAKLSRPKLFL